MVCHQQPVDATLVRGDTTTLAQCPSMKLSLVPFATATRHERPEQPPTHTSAMVLATCVDIIALMSAFCLSIIFMYPDTNEGTVKASYSAGFPSAEYTNSCGQSTLHRNNVSTVLNLLDFNGYLQRVVKGRSSSSAEEDSVVYGMSRGSCWALLATLACTSPARSSMPVAAPMLDAWRLLTSC